MIGRRAAPRPVLNMSASCIQGDGGTAEDVDLSGDPEQVIRAMKTIFRSLGMAVEAEAVVVVGEVEPPTDSVFVRDFA